MLENEVKTVLERLSPLKNIVITTHVNPDGDAIGASLAFYNYFNSKGFQCRVIVPNEIPEYLMWLQGADTILQYNSQTDTCNTIINNCDAIFCVDFNAANRLDKLKDAVLNSESLKVLIDHHLFPEFFCDITFSYTQTSSTCELIYNFIMLAGDKALITKEIAEALYVGIITDTGSYSYSCNYEATYLATAHLFTVGIDGADIHHKIYDTYSEARLRLLGYCLSERLVVFREFGTAYIYLTKEDLLKYDYQTGDTEGVVNYALALKGINFAALFTEREEKIRISLRSKGNFSVNEFSKKYFNGGGHKNAAGGDSFISMNETLEKFELFAKQHQSEIIAS